MTMNTDDLAFLIAWCVALTLLLVGCSTGKIINHRVESWTAQTQTVDLGKGVKVVVVSPVKGQTDEQTVVRQPDKPAGNATLVTPTASATVPPSYQPAGPASPAQTALGSMIWIGGAIMALGALGLALRWFTPFGAIIPVGVSAMIAAAGGLMIAYVTVLDRAPWWVTWLCVVGVVVAGVIIAMRDNWVKVQAAAPLAAAKAIAKPAPITANINGGAS